jgi:hypothetical protein
MLHWNGIVEKKLICGFGYTLIRKFCNFTQNPKSHTLTNVSSNTTQVFF